MRGGALRRRREDRAGTPFLKTSLGLVVGKVLSLGVGFLFWVLAAGAAGVGDIGLAAGAISLMMLATQLAIAGTGSAFIINRSRFEDDLAELLHNAVTLVVLGGAAASLGSLVVVVLAMEELRPVATDPVFAALFVLMTVFGTLGILLDHVSVALHRGDQVVSRNLTGGVLTAAPLLVAPAVGWRLEAQPLFALWVLGGAASCAIAAWQLSRHLDGYRYRPRLSRMLYAVLLRTGLPNHALTLVERAPNLLLPVVVTEVLSPEANAFWYVAWMTSWAVLVIPISIGMTLLAQVSGATASVRRDVLRAGRTGLGLGIPAAVVVAIAAPRVMSLMGPGFSAEAVAPLRILLLGLLPVLLLQLYYSLCRCGGRLREALLTGAVLACAALLVPAAVADTHGLVGMASSWVAVQAVAAIWATGRLIAFARGRVLVSGALPRAGGTSDGGIRTIPVQETPTSQKIGR